MTATLYSPGKAPVNVSAESLYLPDKQTGLVAHSDRAAMILGCAPQLVDILASGSDFVIYSIFDSEGPVNEGATQALRRLSKAFGNEALLGPILLLTI